MNSSLLWRWYVVIVHLVAAHSLTKNLTLNLNDIMMSNNIIYQDSRDFVVQQTIACLDWHSISSQLITFDICVASRYIGQIALLNVIVFCRTANDDLYEHQCNAMSNQNPNFQRKKYPFCTRNIAVETHGI